ncbi:histidine kinase/DNA gyrase B/HSP90-like ATPase [Litoreibacter ponti]|uniref:histidine kinase n=1 Tax=Litoreibacter ponti TaxID=1510457 RepID=A0A2T6BLX2_9RHOB|nr:sensor histidine kinase [Litoreibacter ponti]PTX57080.1 histidine kinase/DNA gyrase B/HSP90-like ATPase [Litoreibacter ponti]
MQPALRPETHQVPDPAAEARAEFEEFVYILSHDLRASIRAMSELPEWIHEDLLEAGLDLPDSVVEYFGLMRTHTARLDQMLLDLLTYSRVGRMQTVQVLDVGPALNAVLGKISGIGAFEITRDLSQSNIRMGDRDLDMLLDCLLTNAVKHNPEGAGHIRISTHVAERDVVIEVSDDGPGIPEKERERLLGPMTTLKSRDEIEGSGMGLAIANKITKHYDGALELASGTDGRGLSVRVQIKQPLQS